MFGDYTPEVRINPTIWLGQKNDADAKANACIKVVSLPQDAERDIQPARKLLISAAIQQAIAEHSIRWAPVLQLGSDGLDSFCVTQRFPRSLQSLIDDRVEISAEQLRTIMLEMVEGLIDLEHTYNLPHGNLKPSNVFLTHRFDILEHSVRLSDPDATEEENPEGTGVSDARAMGRILYALATFEAYNPEGGPLTDLMPWRRLGMSGKRWFELCNRLLEVSTRPGLAKLSEIRMQISQIRVPRRLSLMSVFF